MADIVNPNLPADLPTDWTTEQYVSPNGSEVSLSQQHGYNYLMEQVNAAQKAVNTLAEQAQEAVSGLESGALTATAERSGSTVAITGPEDAVTVTFLAPADWKEDDSYTYNGTPITVTDLNGNPVTDGWKQGAVLTFQISGGVAYFVGGASGSFLLLSGGTMTGPAVGAPGGSTIPQFRNVYYGTEALTPGSSPLPEGTLYITPEMEYEGAGKRTCRFVVGTSTAGWTAADCDYLCDGTADDVEINAAIQALPSTGGEIVILDGTYNITATIALNKDNVTLSGNGAATILQRGWNDSTNPPVIEISSPNGGNVVQRLTIDGQRTTYPSYGYAVQILSGSCNRVSKIQCNNSIWGIVCSSGTQNNEIVGNICDGNSNNGVILQGPGNIVSSNIIINSASYGVSVRSSGNVIASNLFDNCDSSGVLLASGANNNLVSGNLINNSPYMPIEIRSNQNVISNNVITSDSVSSYSIFASSIATNNLVVGNIIMGKNYTDEGTNNTWANNKFE